MTEIVEQKNLTFDMDGVLADFNNGVRDRMLATPELAHLITPDLVVTTFDYELSFPQHYRDHIRSLYRNADFFLHLEPLPGSLEALERLADNGIKPGICTKPFKDIPEAQITKMRWICDHIYPRVGPLGIRSTIFTRDKASHADLGILIDDISYYQKYLEGSIPWIPVTFDTLLNQEDGNPYRFNWQNYEEVLCRLGIKLKPLKKYWHNTQAVNSALFRT